MMDEIMRQEERFYLIKLPSLQRKGILRGIALSITLFAFWTRMSILNNLLASAKCFNLKQP